MLSAAHRLTEGESFTRTVRLGRRASSRALVLHLLVDEGRLEHPEPTRAGLIVRRAVGGSVVRNRVKRRLRHLLRERIDRVPAGSLIVVRALPASAAASWTALAADLDRCLERVADRIAS